MAGRTRWITRLLLMVVGCAALTVVVSSLERRRPFRELERAGASIVEEADGSPRTISFCSPQAGDRHVGLMSEFATVSSINLGRSSVSAAGLRKLRALPRLDSLDLSETAGGDGMFAALAEFPALSTLQLRRCPWVTDEGLEQLSRLEDLECLMIIGAPITDRGLATLARFRNLKQLGIDDCALVTDAGLRSLARHPGLETVSVSGCAGVSDAGVSALVGMRSLRTLTACGIPMRRAALRDIVARRSGLDLTLDRFEFSDLQPLVDIGARIGLDADFEVAWVEIDDQWHDPREVSPFSLTVEPGTDVPYVETQSQQVVPSEDLLDALRVVPDASALHLRSIAVSASGLKRIGELKHLQQLVLENVPLTDDDLPALSACQALEVLWLRRVPVTGEGIAALRNLPRLREFSLLSDRLSQAGIDAATSLHNLDTLALGDVSAVSTAAQIARMPRLCNLAMVRVTITADDMQLLATSPHLQQLELLHANLPHDALAPLEQMTVLQALYLARCEYDREALLRLRDRRPDLNILGTTELSRTPRPPFLPDRRRLLGGIPLFAPHAPAAVH
jgi:hypothetical protein